MASLSQLRALPNQGVRSIIAGMVRRMPPSPLLEPLEAPRTRCPYSSAHHAWIPTFEADTRLMYEVD
eukprot:134246-Heterocapsa_arctica.AAC.1